MRMNVNVAGSIEVCLSAARQSRELLANAIIASRVRMKLRDFMGGDQISDVRDLSWSGRSQQTRRRLAWPGLSRGKHLFQSFFNWLKSSKHLFGLGKSIEWNA